MTSVADQAVESSIAVDGRFVAENRGVVVEALNAPAPHLRPQETTVAMWGFCGYCTNYWGRAYLEGLNDTRAVHRFLGTHMHRVPLTTGERDVVRRELILRRLNPAGFDVWTREPCEGADGADGMTVGAAAPSGIRPETYR